MFSVRVIVSAPSQYALQGGVPIPKRSTHSYTSGDALDIGKLHWRPDDSLPSFWYFRTCKDGFAGPFAQLCVVPAPGSLLKPLKGTIQPDYYCRKRVRYRWSDWAHSQTSKLFKINFFLNVFSGHMMTWPPFMQNQFHKQFPRKKFTRMNLFF